MSWVELRKENLYFIASFCALGNRTAIHHVNHYLVACARASTYTIPIFVAKPYL